MIFRCVESQGMHFVHLSREITSETWRHVTCNLKESQGNGERKKQGCLKRREWHSRTFQRRCNTILACVRFAFGERLLAKCSRAAALDRRKRPSFVFLRWTNSVPPSAISIAKETEKRDRKPAWNKNKAFTLLKKLLIKFLSLYVNRK